MSDEQDRTPEDDNMLASRNPSDVPGQDSPHQSPGGGVPGGGAAPPPERADADPRPSTTGERVGELVVEEDRGGGGVSVPDEDGQPVGELPESSEE